MILEAVQRLRANLLTAMSFQRKKAVKAIEGYHITLARHMTVCAVWPDVDSTKHHVNEVIDYLEIIHAWTNVKGGRLEQHTLLKLLWEGPFGDDDHNGFRQLKGYIRYWEAKGLPKAQVDLDKVFKKLKLAYSRLMFEVANDFDHAEVNRILDDLMKG